MQEPTQSPQQHSINVPVIVWLFLCCLVGLFIGYSVVINWQAMPRVTREIWVTVLIVLIIVSIYLFIRVCHSVFMFIHTAWHEVNTRKRERLQLTNLTLKNRKLEGELAVMGMMPDVLKYAIDAGHNVEYSGIKVISPLSNVHAFPTEGKVQQLLPTGPERIPEPYRFSETLQHWTPTREGILLGRSHEQLVTVGTGEAMCHTALAGRTDSGKTNTELLLMAQLLFLGECVYLCNPHYRRLWQDTSGETFDLTVMEPHLAYEPITEPHTVIELLTHLKYELDDRKLKAKYQLARFDNVYLFMDELPAIAHYVPDVMDMLGVFLRESRKYGIFFVGAAQDMLNATLDSDNGAVRQNFLTNYYGGGDETTARLLLDLAKGEKLDQTGLGRKGLFYINAKSIGNGKQRVRTPLVDSRSLSMLFTGRSPAREYEQRMIIFGGSATPPAGGDPLRPGRENTDQAPYVAATRLRTRPGKKTLDDAINAWNEAIERGAKPGARQLERDMNIPYNHAREFSNRIKALEAHKSAQAS